MHDEIQFSVAIRFDNHLINNDTVQIFLSIHINPNGIKL